MSQSDSYDEEEMVERIREGDERAFEVLFREHSEDLCEFACSFVESPEVAEDLVHDVFCDVWDRRNDLDPSGTVKAYLFQAVRNKALNWLKAQRVRDEWKTEKKHKDTESFERASAAAEYNDLEEALRQAVEELPERQRLVYKMVRNRDMSYAEVAAALDITKKTVENQMGRALKHLHERLSLLLRE